MITEIVVDGKVVRWWYEMPTYTKEQVVMLKTDHPGGLHQRNIYSEFGIPFCNNPIDKNDKKNRVTWIKDLDLEYIPHK